MEQSSEGGDKNDAASYQSLIEETITTERQLLTTSIKTLTPQLPSFSSSFDTLDQTLHVSLSEPALSLDLMAEILCRLPVKFLMRFRCVCKSWNSLISDRKFSKKHLHMSTTSHCHHHLVVSSTNSSNKFLLWDSPISSIFSGVSTSSITQTQLRYPTTLSDSYIAGLGICSCDGILCFAINESSALLWNPSIRKCMILPPLETSWKTFPHSLYSFGYDHFTNNYKIVAISFCKKRNFFCNEVSVHTLGTDSWRKIQDFPYCGSISEPGIFVSNTLNWLSFEAPNSSQRFIVSLDLEKESYQKVLHPDLKKDSWTLGVLRDCLCIFASSDMFLDVWVMKEYGNKESWAKLFSIPYTRDHGFYVYTKVLYISEDDQVLLSFKETWKLKLVVYDSKNDTLKFPEIQNINDWMVPLVYAESLISPCS